MINQDDQTKPEASKKKDYIVLYWFLAFFGTFMILDGIFVYLAVSTQTGLVTEQAYEKGLDYNKTLHEAGSQPAMNDVVSYENGVLKWVIKDAENNLVEADAQARFFRQVQDGHDFTIPLKRTQSGVYEARPDIPLKGLWMVKLQSQWKNNTYKTSFNLINR